MKKLVIRFILLALCFPFFLSAQLKNLPESGEILPIQWEKPIHFELTNGIQVFFLKNKQSGLAQFQFFRPSPPQYEKDKAGTSDLLLRLMGKGTQKLSKNDFLEIWEYHAAYLYFDTKRASFSCLQKHSSTLLPLFAEAIREPRWEEAFFEDEKQKMIESLEANANNASFLAWRLQAKLSYTPHPYSETSSIESLKNIDLEDIKKAHKNMFNPEGSFLFISGDFDPKKLKKELNKYFGKWESKPDPIQPYSGAELPKETYIALLDLPDAVQSQISVSYPLHFQKKNKDYLALRLANTIFGQAFNSRLNMNLREEHGYTYGARGGVNDDYYQAAFTAQTKVRNEVTVAALLEILKEMDEMHSLEIQDEELTIAKAGLKGDFVRAFEDPAFPLRMQAEILTEELDPEFYRNYLNELEDIDKEAVKQVIDRYYHKDQLILLLVGKATDFITELKQLPYPIKYFDKQLEITTAHDPKEMEVNP